MKSNKNIIINIIACIVLFLNISLLSAQEEHASNKTLSPYFFIENGDSSIDKIPLKATNVEVYISGVIAEVNITQIYENKGTRPINARYIFPASTRAAVHAMKMKIGNQLIIAKVKEREQAKAEYQQAVKEGKSASLLEQQRPNVFSMSVGNIMPGDVVEITLSYTELLVPTDSIYEFVFPTVVGPRYSNQPKAAVAPEDKFVETPYLKEGTASTIAFNITVTLSTGMPLQEVTCTTHQTLIEWKSKSEAVIRLDRNESAGGNRDYIVRYKLAGQQIASGLLLYEGAQENFFLYVAQPPERVTTADIPPREYIFVVDVSGSMHGFPLEISKSLMKKLIGNLRPTDRFNVVLFSGSSRTMSSESVPASEKNISEAISFITTQRGGGGTEMRAALEEALRIPQLEHYSRTVIIATDGYVDAERSVFDLIRNNLSNTNFFAFGIGSSVNRYLIEGIAKAGQGEPFIVTRNNEEALVAAEKFRQYVQSPVLTHITLSFDGLDVYDIEPAGFPDLMAQRPLVVYGKWKGSHNGSITLTGESGSGPFKQTINVTTAVPEQSNDAIRYLWARTRIAALSDYGTRESAEEHRNEIIALGLDYNLMTAYTSFIAVHEVIRNTEGNATNVDQPLPLPQGVSNLAVGEPLAGMPEPELSLLLICAVMVALTALLRYRKEEDYQRTDNL